MLDEMTRLAPVLFLLALSACGSRTGLGLEAAHDDGGSPLDANGDGQTNPDAAPDAPREAAPDAPTEAGVLLCPLTPPEGNTICEDSTTVIQCAYPDTSPSGGITTWCCMSGGWVNCTIGADTGFTCADIVCFAGVYEECIVAGGEQCCTCSADMTVDQCGPC